MSQSGIKEPGKRQWRDYRTASGNRPVKAFLDGLSDDELASVVAEMKAVAANGLGEAMFGCGSGGPKGHRTRADGTSRKTSTFTNSGRGSDEHFGLGGK